MKALVIGGNRFFGKRLVSFLLEGGAQVTLLNRGRRPDPFGDRVERLQFDRKDLSAKSSPFGNREWDIVYDQACYDAREAAGVCEALAGRFDRFVFTSSQSVYGPGQDIREDFFRPEAHRFSAPVDSAQDYAEAKRQAESVFAKELGDRVTCVRFPIVMGEDDYTERLKFHIDHVKAGRAMLLPNRAAEISFVQSSDAAKFLFSLASMPCSGPVNVCGKKPISIGRVLQIVEEAVGRKALDVAPGGEDDASPYGIESDWWMNTDRLSQLGFEADAIENWLPALVHAVSMQQQKL